MSGYSTPGLVWWRRLTDAPLLILAVGSLPLLLLELARNDLTKADKTFLDVVNVIVLVAFAIDYIAESGRVSMAGLTQGGLRTGPLMLRQQASNSPPC